MKRRRSSRNETVQYLREKNELLAKFRIEDKAFEAQKLRYESQRHQEFMKRLSEQQNTLQHQQQQQNQLIMAIISELGSN